LDIYTRVTPVSANLAHAFLARYAPHWRDERTWGTADALDILTRGLEGEPPADGTALYFHGERGLPLAPGLEYVILAFDDVAGMTLGLSIDEEDDPEPVLSELQAFAGTTLGFWACEWPPPRSETDWQEALEHNRPGRA
jgi:hypothetical protein